MTNKKGRSKESKLTRYVKAPVRFLIKARDIYVQGMTKCSGHFTSVDAAMGCPGQLCALPRSFNVTSTRSSASEDDFKELITAASLRSHDNSVEFGSVEMKMPWIHSVGFARIDEDKPCDFGDDIKVKTCVYPRRRRYAILRDESGRF